MAEEKKDEASEALGGAGGPPSPAGAATARAKGMPDWVRFPLVLSIVGVASAMSLAGIYSLTKEKIDESKLRKVEGAFESVLGARYDPKRREKLSFGEGDDAFEHYILRRGDGSVLARAAEVSCPESYNTSEPIRLMLVADPKVEAILGVRVVASKETPGLGEKIKERPSARSIVGGLLGREPKRRVVLDGGGAVVGRVEKREDGSVVLERPDAKRRELKPGEFIEVTEAPFPPAFLDQFTGLDPGEAVLRSEGGEVDAITGATVSSRAVVNGVREAVERLGRAVAAGAEAGE
jgi:Na+-translocating ferredoxin:NAD+ oxidoreductase RnfG subunit